MALELQVRIVGFRLQGFADVGFCLEFFCILFQLAMSYATRLKVCGNMADGGLH